MNINLNALISVETLTNNPEKVFDIIEEYGQAVILKDNTPAYVITNICDIDNDINDGIKSGIKNDTNKSIKNEIQSDNSYFNKYKLHEAMEIVLKDNNNIPMSAPEIANEIYIRELYLKKDGTKAKANQIRARANIYRDMFISENGKLRLANPISRKEE